jgi:hypothetical protein
MTTEEETRHSIRANASNSQQQQPSLTGETDRGEAGVVVE